ncbi:MAG: hypothetical protein AB7Q97_03340 [Gammaproteobacteria bacterium]
MSFVTGVCRTVLCDCTVEFKRRFAHHPRRHEDRRAQHPIAAMNRN